MKGTLVLIGLKKGGDGKIFSKWFKESHEQEKPKEIEQLTDEELKNFIAETEENMNKQMRERIVSNKADLDPVLIDMVDKVMSAIEEAQKRSLQILLSKGIFWSILDVFSLLTLIQCTEMKVLVFNKCPICSSQSEVRRYRIDQALQSSMRLLRVASEVPTGMGVPIHYYDVMIRKLVEERLDDLIARLNKIGETVGFDRDFPPGNIVAAVCPKCKIAAFPIALTTIKYKMKEDKLYAIGYSLCLLNLSAYALHYIIRYKLQWTKEGFKELENWKRV